MRYLQAGWAFAIFGWISLGLQAGWIRPSGQIGLLPAALERIGMFPTTTILFFIGAASASWLLLRNT